MCGSFPSLGSGHSSHGTGLDTFINYHNPRTMGTEFSELSGLDCVTNKRGKALPSEGDLVYLIGRKTGDERFFLYGAFCVSTVRKADDPDFETLITGTHGFLYKRAKVLDEFPWFPQFKREQGNFGLGTNRVSKPERVAQLHALIAPKKLLPPPPKGTVASSPSSSYTKASRVVWDRYKRLGATYVERRKWRMGIVQKWSFPNGGGVEFALIVATTHKSLDRSQRRAIGEFLRKQKNYRAFAMRSSTAASPTGEWFPAPPT